MANNIQYNFQCILGAPCSEEGYVAQIYDYIGAVFGEEGKVQYDGILTPAERVYVERKFGELAKSPTPRSDSKSFLSNSRNIFFRDTHAKVSVNVDCNPSEFSFNQYETKTLGKGFVIGGTHTCGIEFSNLYLSHSIEEEVAANAGGWVFFVEGSSPVANNDNDFSDLLYFNRIATKLSIPMLDPIIPITDEKVLKEAEKRTNLHKIDFAVASVLLNGAELDLSVRQSVLEEAELYKIDPKKLAARVSEFTRSSSKLNKRESLAKMDQLDKRRRVLLGISNELTTLHVKELLEKSGRRKALFIIGGAHVPAIEAVYKKITP